MAVLILADVWKVMVGATVLRDLTFVKSPTHVRMVVRVLWKIRRPNANVQSVSTQIVVWILFYHNYICMSVCALAVFIMTHTSQLYIGFQLVHVDLLTLCYIAKK